MTVVELTIQANHLDLIVEAAGVVVNGDDRRARRTARRRERSRYLVRKAA
jgi:hypothetical protein